MIDTIQRYLLFIIGLFFSALGVAITKKRRNWAFPDLLGGECAEHSAAAAVAGLLAHHLELCADSGANFTAAAKVPMAPAAASAAVLSVWLVYGFRCLADSFFTPKHYVVQILLVLAGTVVLGFGITLAVIANVILNSGEAFVKALSDTIHKEFGNVKIAFDISCVVVAVILSFLFFHKLVGTREGTVIAAFCTGFVVKFFSKYITAPLERFLKKNIGE
mgnify:CR=1 FL=1